MCEYVDIPPQLAGEEAGRLYLARSPKEYESLKGVGECAVPVTEKVEGSPWDGCMGRDCPYIIEKPGELSAEDFIPIYRRLKGLPLVILETERTLVREFCLNDCNNPAFCALESLREDEAYVGDYCKYVYGFYNYGIWLITDKITYDIIGCAGLKTEKVNDDGERGFETLAVSCGKARKTWDPEHYGRDDEAPFLGYEILPEYRGRGYATEACRGILEYAAGSLGFDRVYARIKKDNQKSKMVAKRLGFQYTTFQLFS